MTAVWDKLFGNAPLPANDAPLERPQGPSSQDYEQASSKDNLLSRAPERERERTVDQASKSVASTFDSIGRRNETLRAQLDAIEFAFSNIEMIRSHFLGVLSPIDEILGEIERTNTKRHDAESKLEALGHSHEKLKNEASDVTVERNALALKQSEFVARISDSEKAMQKAMTELAEARAGQSSQSARAERLERELDDSKRRLATVSEQLPSLRTEFVAKEKKLQEVEQQRADLEDRQKLAQQEMRSMRMRIEEMVANASKLNRTINELEGRNGDAGRRISELEAALAQEIASHGRLKTSHLDDAETHRLTLSKAHEEISGLKSRTEGGERLLAEARAEARERNATIRTLEQNALEASVLAQAQDQRQAELEAALAAARGKHSEIENVRAGLETRVADLTRGLESKTTALARADEQVASLEARIAAEVKLAISELEARDTMIARLRAELETQSSARAFAEGALQSARQERVSWRNTVDANVASGNEGREKIGRLRA